MAIPIAYFIFFVGYPTSFRTANKATITPKRATPSMNAAVIIAKPLMSPPASGCLAIPSIALPANIPIPTPAPITANPAPNAANPMKLKSITTNNNIACKGG